MFITVIAVGVTTVCVGIGLIGKIVPKWFLRFNGGFIPWAITGNPMPPFFSNDAWDVKEVDSWVRDTDIIVSVGTKSGTNWMLYLLHQIRTRGDEERFPFTEVMYSTIWPELIQTPGDSWANQKLRYGTTILPDGTPLKQYCDHPEYPFRVIKSHCAPLEAGGAMPVKHLAKRNVKIIAMARNGLDMVASFAPFVSSVSDFWQKSWGGFPFAFKGDINEAAKESMAWLLPGGVMAEAYFGYVKGWWEMKDEPNVLLLHYSDCKADFSDTVSKVANFVGIRLTSKEHKKIVEKCSFAQMKSISNQFDSHVPWNPMYDGTKSMMNSGVMIRKGQIGDGKVLFTPDQQSTWEKAEEDELGEKEVKIKNS